MKSDINLTREREEDTYQIQTSVPNNHLQQMYQESNKVLLAPLTETVIYGSPKLTLNSSNAPTFTEENLQCNIRHLEAQKNMNNMKTCSNYQILISLYNRGRV
jgi:hypothetical protein